MLCLDLGHCQPEKVSEISRFTYNFNLYFLASYGTKSLSSTLIHRESIIGFVVKYVFIL